MRKNSALETIMRIRDGLSMTLAQIQTLGSELGAIWDKNVVFVEWVQLSWGNEANLLMILYRNGRFLAETFLKLKLEQVQTWVEENLKGKEPLRYYSANLKEMEDLIAPLKENTEPDEMLVLCPTGILHRVPLHAINLGQGPLILRNPVIYTQSLSMLRLCLTESESGFNPAYQIPEPSPPSPQARAVVIHPLDAPYASTKSITSVANISGAAGSDFLDGPMERSKFLHTAADASLLHYHGHVDRGEQAIKLSENKSEETLVRTGAIFDMPLAKNALVTLIGCISNEATVNKSDDFFGIPTALHYAGATSVMSTLWNADHEDAEMFSSELYLALEEQVLEMAENEERIMNLAIAIQNVVRKMRKLKPEAFHWASFVLNGMWRWRVPNGLFIGDEHELETNV
jgi:CHAT domain-containing protein